MLFGVPQRRRQIGSCAGVDGSEAERIDDNSEMLFVIPVVAIQVEECRSVRGRNARTRQALDLRADRGRIEGGRHEVDSKEPCIGSGAEKVSTLCRTPASEEARLRVATVLWTLSRWLRGACLLTYFMGFSCFASPAHCNGSSPAGSNPEGRSRGGNGVWLCEGPEAAAAAQRVEGQGASLRLQLCDWDASARYCSCEMVTAYEFEVSFRYVDVEKRPTGGVTGN